MAERMQPAPGNNLPGRNKLLLTSMPAARKASGVESIGGTWVWLSARCPNCQPQRVTQLRYLDGCPMQSKLGHEQHQS
eukprot:4871731-Amphidinium_carterae.1